jgi:hypothetical protein
VSASEKKDLCRSKPFSQADFVVFWGTKMKMVTIVTLVVLATAVASGMAAAQQASQGTVAAGSPAQGTMQTFTLGGDSRYTIGQISQIDAWRASEMGIPWVSLPSGTTVHVVYMTGMPSATGTSTDSARMIAFGPPGYVGTGSWSGTGGSAGSYSFSGNAGQYFLVTQQSGGTMDRVVVSFG